MLSQADGIEGEIALHLADRLSWEDFRSLLTPEEMNPDALRRMFESEIEISVPETGGGCAAELKGLLRLTVAGFLDQQINWDVVKVLFEESV